MALVLKLLEINVQLGVVASALAVRQIPPPAAAAHTRQVVGVQPGAMAGRETILGGKRVCKSAVGSDNGLAFLRLRLGIEQSVMPQGYTKLGRRMRHNGTGSRGRFAFVPRESSGDKSMGAARSVRPDDVCHAHSGRAFVKVARNLANYMATLTIC